MSLQNMEETRGYMENVGDDFDNAATHLEEDHINQLVDPEYGKSREQKEYELERSTRSRKLTEKGKEYKISLLEEKKENLLKELMEMSSGINELLLSQHNASAVKNELDYFDAKFNILFDVHQEMMEMDKDYSSKLWFDDIDEHVYILKTRVMDWLQEIDINKRKSSRYSSVSSRDKGSTKSSISERVIEESIKAAELLAEASFKEKRISLEAEAEKLKLEQEVARANAKMKVLQFYEDYKTGGKRSKENAVVLARSYNKKESYPFPEKREESFRKTDEYIKPDWLSESSRNRLDHMENQSCRRKMNRYSNNDGNYCPDKSSYKVQSDGKAKMIQEINPSFNMGQNINSIKDDTKDILFKLLRQQSAPDIEIEQFDGNPLNFNYFMAIFQEVVEKNIEDSKGRLIRLIKSTSGEARELVKNCVHYPDDSGYEHAMCLLKRRYGNPYQLMAAYRKEIKDWPLVKAGDAAGFRRFFNFLLKFQSAAKNIQFSIVDSPDILCMLVAKLPNHLHHSWNKKVYKLRQEKNRDPDFTDLLSFVDEATSLVNDPLFSKEGLSYYAPKMEKVKGKVFKSYATAAVGQCLKEKENMKKPSEPRRRHCSLCDLLHDIEECNSFLDQSIEERSKTIFRLKLCYGCFEPISKEHSSRTCKSRRICKVCQGSHPTTLHGFKLKTARNKPNKEESKKEKDDLSEVHGSNTKLNCNSTSMGSTVVSMCIVPVRIRQAGKQKQIETYALLDSCSQGSFITEQLINETGASGKETSVTIKTLTGEITSKSMAIEGLEVSSRHNPNSEWLKLPKLYTKEDLPVNEDDISTPDKLKGWKYLDSIADQFNDMKKLPIGILIGANCPKALEPTEVIPAKDNGPYAFKTKLGWCVVGPISHDYGKEMMSCNRIVVKEAGTNNLCRHHLEISNKVEEVKLKEMLENLYAIEFPERQYAKQEQMEDALSAEDKDFLKLVNAETKLVGNHYQVPLPFRKENVFLPSNRAQALRRLDHLKRRFYRDPRFFDEYKKAMNDMIFKGYAEISASNSTKEGQTWYIPHHGVHHPNKPGKFRIVFDCGAEQGGMSLNKELLSGPDLSCQLIGVLMRFREEEIAIICDIEKMFYQVMVPPQQRSFLKLLWWEDGDPSKRIIEYQMTVHVFGATSSPSCSNYALKRTAQDNAQDYDPEVASTLFNNFYVDDLLTSVNSVDKCISLVRGVRSICSKGGFNLTKFATNNEQVKEAIANDVFIEKDQKVKILDSTDEKALGLQWQLKEDVFTFEVNLKEKPYTRRGLLSTVSSIYDPLGLISPFMLKGRKIIQQLCKNNISWDETISDLFRNEFLKWKSQLDQLQNIEIKRCYKPSGFGKVIDCSLHHFSDASQDGYGQASYIRLINERGDIHCSLVMAKSRVAPVKFLSIPRLELMAAVLSVQISQLIKGELALSNHSKFEEVFWTDSQVVLGYINNNARRFKVFVANRVQIIKDYSKAEQWNYVASHDNPADLASRGLNVNQTDKVKMWFEGPRFLWLPKSSWQLGENSLTVKQDDPELKAISCNYIASSTDLLAHLEKRTSNWNKMRKVLSWVIFFVNRLKERCSDKTRRNFDNSPNLEDVQKAENHLIQVAQARAFEDELKILKASKEGSPIKQDSSIYKLDPFVDENGILRVGGRLKRSKLNLEFKHPILLPKTSNVTDAIINYCHESVGHSGRGATLNQIRKTGYWVINGNSVVKAMIHKCVTCRRLRGKLGIQKMGELPLLRTEEAPPFTYCGIDVFGHYTIKVRRSELKRYCVMFTCLSSRAVHIEIIGSMDTDSFILSLRRFICRRGNVRIIWSDNGSNFIGAENELLEAFKEMDQDRIKSFLQLHRGDWLSWKKNPPTASHMGGVWERQIRTARNIFKGLLKTHSYKMNDEGFHTLMVEVEAIMNSRPLTVNLINDVNSESPLSPNNILTLKSNFVFPPPGNFDKPDIYSRKMWRRVQYLANEFWNRWRKEYLAELQSRQKWNATKRNFRIGDIILLKDDSITRNHWPMGKIVNLENDMEGNVRTVDVKLSSDNGGRILRRPISKLVLLLESECSITHRGSHN